MLALSVPLLKRVQDLNNHVPSSIALGLHFGILGLPVSPCWSEVHSSKLALCRSPKLGPQTYHSTSRASIGSFSSTATYGIQLCHTEFHNESQRMWTSVFKAPRPNGLRTRCAPCEQPPPLAAPSCENACTIGHLHPMRLGGINTTNVYLTIDLDDIGRVSILQKHSKHKC